MEERCPKVILGINPNNSVTIVRHLKFMIKLIKLLVEVSCWKVFRVRDMILLNPNCKRHPVEMRVILCCWLRRLGLLILKCRLLVGEALNLVEMTLSLDKVTMLLEVLIQRMILLKRKLKRLTQIFIHLVFLWKSNLILSNMFQCKRLLLVWNRLILRLIATPVSETSTTPVEAEVTFFLARRTALLSSPQEITFQEHRSGSKINWEQQQMLSKISINSLIRLMRQMLSMEDLVIKWLSSPQSRPKRDDLSVLHSNR